MSTICFTSFNFAYSTRASILAKTLKKHMPSWEMVGIVTDKPEKSKEKLIKKYFDRIIYTQDLEIPNYDKLLNAYSVVEICTAVKGDALCAFLKEEFDNIVYLDPDIAVYGNLGFIDNLLKEYSILLTPHIIDPEADGNELAIIESEVNALKYGVFNLGFIAINNSKEGVRFANWWRDRLRFKCIDNPGEGYFTDQKWCNHVPVFFEKVKIIKDYGCNVASWNLNERKVRINENGEIFCNHDLLKFYHFTKFGSLGFEMTKRYAKNNYEVFELWSHYSRMLMSMEEVIYET